jgi:hypothetical protein
MIEKLLGYYAYNLCAFTPIARTTVAAPRRTGWPADRQVVGDDGACQAPPLDEGRTSWNW